MTAQFPNKTEVLKAIAKHRAQKERVVFTNGCFDLLHVGHTRYLAEAKKLGQILVVGLNSDTSVRQLKGPARPILSAAERCEVLLALKSVDYVCVFDEDTPENLIHEIHPDVLVKGGDWPIEKIVGHDFVSSYGGKVMSLSFHPGQSTSAIVQRIRA